MVEVTDMAWLHLALLWLWRRPAATAPIQPLAWEPPCAVGAGLRNKRKKKSAYQEGLSSPLITVFLHTAENMSNLLNYPLLHCIEQYLTCGK